LEEFPFGIDSLPALIQFDGETQNGGKLAKMNSIGFYFLDEDGQKCKFSAIEVYN
jgi:ribosomal protein L15E